MIFLRKLLICDLPEGMFGAKAAVRTERGHPWVRILLTLQRDPPGNPGTAVSFPSEGRAYWWPQPAPAPRACPHFVVPGVSILWLVGCMQPNTKLQIYLKLFFAYQFLLVFVYLLCGPRQLFFFQRGPETPNCWTPLVTQSCQPFWDPKGCQVRRPQELKQAAHMEGLPTPVWGVLR